MREALAESLAAIRPGGHPLDPLDRVRWPFALFAALNALAVVPLVTTGPSATLGGEIATAVGGVVLAATWIVAAGRRSFGLSAEVLTLASFGVIVAAQAGTPAPERLLGLAFGALLFTSLFGSLPRVAARGAALAALELAIAWPSQPAARDVAMLAALVTVAAAARVLRAVAIRYGAGVRREQTLARAGLALVAAPDLASIVRIAVDAAYALGGADPNGRAWLALGEMSPGGADAPTGSVLPAMRVVGATGQESTACLDRIVDPALLPNFADWQAPQLLLFPTAEQGERLALAGPSLVGQSLLYTRIDVDGSPRGCLVVEATGGISRTLASAVAALVTQLSLAVSRSDLQLLMVQRQSTERFQALVQNSTDVITIVDPDGRIRFQSPSTQHVLGYDPDAMAGSFLAGIVHPEDAPTMAEAFRRVLDNPEAQPVVECRVLHADGTWRHTESRLSNLVAVPAVSGLVLNTRDVTERRSLEDELRHQAFHDALTGLANRALFVDRTAHALAHAQRDGATLAVVFIDLGGFKRVNDSLGYAAGDAALCAVAERLRGCVRLPDTVARLGADEFSVLVDRLSSGSDATIAVERILNVLRQPFPLPGALVELQPYIGIAISVAGDETPEELLRNSAVAMHRAKALEIGYAMFDPEMHAGALRRLEVESELRLAIDQGQLVLHYQPIIALDSGHMTAVEALVRWQHPTRGLIPPLEFIPLAEETGLIVALGRWALRESCRQVRKWQQENANDVPLCLSVNLSARQLRHPTLVHDVADALDDSGLLPSRLILELTESVLMVDTAATLNKLFQLKALGVRLAIDDFGTGYSSFSYLRRFPIDILKIDKSFVDGIATEPTAGALVDAMIRIGKTLRMETVAEGVERAEQAEQLRALKCDVAQGFLFSRPLASDALTALLVTRERERIDRDASEAPAA